MQTSLFSVFLLLDLLIFVFLALEGVGGGGKEGGGVYNFACPLMTSMPANMFFFLSQAKRTSFPPRTKAPAACGAE